MTSVVLFVGACLLGSGCLSGQPQSASGGCTSNRKVTIAHWGQERILIYLPLYVALDGGFFASECLDVSLKYSGNDDQVFAAVISGSADFGVGDPAFTAISRERGGPGKVVALLVGAVANWGVAAKDSKVPMITDPKQLAGLRVSSFPAPSTTFTILTEVRQKYGLSNMQIKQMASGTELAALERGDVDLAIMLEPQTSIAETMGYRVVWSVAKFYGPFALTGVTTSDDTIARHPDIVQSVVTSIQRALDFIRQNPSATVDIVAKSFPTLPRNVVERAISRMTDDMTIPQSVRISDQAWRKTLAMRVAVGDLKSLASGLGAVDNQFADRAQILAARPSDALPAPRATQAEKRPYLLQPVEIERWRDWIALLADILAILTFLIVFSYFLKERNARSKPILNEYQKIIGRHLLEVARETGSIPLSTLLSDLKARGKREDEVRAVVSRLSQLRLIKQHGDPDKPTLSITPASTLGAIFGERKPPLERSVD
jgi:NitT/TauT family transport system substrate-binding protein